MGLTPNFDRLARAGTHVCELLHLPAALRPGPRGAADRPLRDPDRGLPQRHPARPEDAETLPKVFARAGYRTGYIGKWHLAGGEPVPPALRGG